MEHSSVVDLAMAAREGHDSMRVVCDDCVGIHTLGFRFLRKAALQTISDITEPLDSTHPLVLDEDLYERGYENWLAAIAFCELIGSLRPHQDPHPPITAHLPLLRAIPYAVTFGRGGHFDQLIGGRDTKVMNGKRNARLLATATFDQEAHSMTARLKEAHADA
ncbi:hypothetical protein HQ535_10275 [bacterium]|nr:hypothetical protein [bacterium]